ncbi:hypothetical protein [Parendozoicomonas sp. Alg238-R29]|uniref:hypothetical protein n=1 Tax=Parendozoicomonas sp. Alg238-R29 TaxID=2993446 RepID=UPI00248E5E62|nr:hypothetical protein [Parendozoicomonas sp. Alg238-R29]
MKVLNNIRTNLADFIHNHSSSSRRAGTYLNRLVQFIRPAHSIRSFAPQPGHTPRSVPLAQRHIAHTRANQSVQMLEAKVKKDLAREADQKEPNISHSPDQQKIGIRDAVKYGFQMIDRGQAYEARLFLEDIMNQPGSDPDKVRSDIETMLKGNTQRNHSENSRAIFYAEIENAHDHIKSIEGNYPEDTASDNILYMENRLDEAEEWAGRAAEKDPYLLLQLSRYNNTSNLTRELLRQTSGGHAYRTRVLAEKYLSKVPADQREHSKVILIDKVCNDWASKNYHTESDRAVAERQILAAFEKVSTGNDYPELTPEWHQANPNQDIHEARLAEQLRSVRP